MAKVNNQREKSRRWRKSPLEGMRGVLRHAYGVRVVEGTLSLRVRRLLNHFLLFLWWAHRFTGNGALARLALLSFPCLCFRRRSHNGQGGPSARGAGGRALTFRGLNKFPPMTRVDRHCSWPARGRG